MTMQELTHGRTILGVGVGFTSLRMMGQAPVSRAALKDAIARRGRPVTITPTEGLTVTRLEP